MEYLMQVYYFVKVNYDMIGAFLFSLIATVQILFRLVPTKSGESALLRFAKIVDKLFDKSKVNALIPNLKKEGVLPVPSGTHKE